MPTVITPYPPAHSLSRRFNHAGQIWMKTMVLSGSVFSERQHLRSEWQKPDSISSHSWLFLVLSGIATGLSWLCYYRALQIGPMSKVAPVDKLSVAFAIVLGILFVGEKLTWPLALGGGLIVAGSIVIILF